MTVMTGGEAVYQTLKSAGVDCLFGIPSVHNLPIFDAIARGGDIEAIIVRNEQAAAHSADGYARASGKLGVVLASTGPGTTNTVTGLYEAAFASSRVLLITGQVDTPFYGKGRGPGHEADNQIAMLRTVVRHAESVGQTRDIPRAIERAIDLIQRGRPQPAAVEIPIDLQYAEADVTIAERIAAGDPPSVPTDAADEAAGLLADAERRVILAGGGVVGGNASGQLVALAEALNAPVFTTTNGRGAIPDDHHLAMGAYWEHPKMQAAIADADVVLAVGTRFRGGERVWDATPPGALIHVDADPHALNLVHRSRLSIVADAAAALTAISDRLNAERNDDAFVDAARNARDAVFASVRDRIGPDQAAIMDHIRTRLPRDGVFVRDMTMPAYFWGNQLFPVLAPRTTMNPTSGAIGPGLPLANGAAAATGRKTVVIHGDGGFTVHVGELTTAVQHDLPVVVVVFTDGGYGVLRGFQNTRFDGRTIGVDLATPRFSALAESMGMRGFDADSVDTFRAAFDEAMACPGPALIDLDQSKLQQMAGMHPRVGFARS